MRERRVAVLAALLVLSVGTLGVLAVTYEPVGAQGSTGTNSTNVSSWHTLITVQAYGWFDNHNGEAFAVDEQGNRVWSYQPANSNVFDGEVLDNGHVLLSYGERVPDADCPVELRSTPSDACIRNHVREVDPSTNEVVWEYAWWDRFMSYHEVHDADRLPNGETIIIDMGKDRTFAVDQNGEVTWEWDAVEHLNEGSAFWDEYVEGTSREENVYEGPNQDWSHMNDVDVLPNGHVQMSIRNFDVVITVDPETNDIVRVFGQPGNHSIIHEQHNPHYLPGPDNILVADSENDRIVEYDFNTTEVVWQYEGPSASDRLAWPRDADRLESGTTLITDSRNFRVLEVDGSGDVVWGYSLQDERGIVYDADRIGPNLSIDEEPTNATSGATLAGTSYNAGLLATVDSWLGFVFPPWVGVIGALAVLVGVLAGLGLCWEAVRTRWRGLL